MTTINLKKIEDDYKKASSHIEKRIVICAGTGCIANGSLLVHEAFKKALADAGLELFVDVKLNYHDDEKTYQLTGSGCQGFCAQGPLVNILPDEILYTKVKPEDVEEILDKTVLKGEIIERLLYVNPADG